MMIITYEDQTGLYVNSTNRCSNACEFCVRSYGDTLYGNLWLDREPTVEEITADIERRDLSKYTELVFCGYGEPTERLDDIIAVAKAFKAKHTLPVRINTNGHANLIAGHDVTEKFDGAFDVVSISLNTADPAEYERICHPQYENAYEGLLDFARKVKNYVPRVILSVVDTTIPPEEIERCRAIADSVGCELRVRDMI
ncbi:MAG: TatD family nuclease-associated radical SAM protein [Eubacteriales bacterium]